MRLHYGTFPEVCSRLEFWIRSEMSSGPLFSCFLEFNLGLSRIHRTVHIGASSFSDSLWSGNSTTHKPLESTHKELPIAGRSFPMLLGS